MTSTLFQSIRTAIADRFSRFTWSVPVQRYTGANGTVVPPESVRVVVDKQIAATGKRLEKAGDVLRAAKGTDGWEGAVRAWQTAYQEEIRALHLQTGSLGHGGLHDTPKEALERVEARVAGQFEYHDALVQKILDDPDHVDSGTFALHGDRYAQTARFTYEGERRISHDEAGFDYEHDWRHAIDSCGDCVEAEDNGWVPNGTNKAFEDRECKVCQCTRDFSRGNPDA